MRRRPWKRFLRCHACAERRILWWSIRI